MVGGGCVDPMNTLTPWIDSKENINEIRASLAIYRTNFGGIR